MTRVSLPVAGKHLLCLLLLGFGSMAVANGGTITQVGSVTQTDIIDWQDFNTQVLNSGQGALVGSFNTVTVTNNVSVNVSQAGQSFPNNDFHNSSSFPDAGANLENAIGGGGAINTNPIVLNFGAVSFHAIGFDLAVNSASPFTVTIHAFNSSGTELTSSPLVILGVTNGQFIGIQSTANDIAKVSVQETFSTSSAPNQFVGHVILNSGAAPAGVPEPTTFALALIGGAAAMAYARKRRP